MSRIGSARALTFFAILGLTGSCGTRDTDAQRTVDRPGSLLLRQIRQQVQQTGVPEPVAPAEVNIQVYRSAVLPGVSYYFAGYASQQVSHRYYSAVATARDGRVHVVQTQADWITLAGRWSPATARDAVAACRELFVVLRTRTPDEADFGIGDSASYPALLPQEAARVRSRMNLPSAEKAPGGGWTAAFWVVQPREPRGAVKYRCDFGFRGSGEAVSFVATDSVVFPEAP